MYSNQTAVIFLQKAVEATLPHASNISVEADRQGFSCTFFYSEVFTPTYLGLLEEKMRQFSKEPIEVMEMLASNAKEYFLHHQENSLAEQLDRVGGTVWVCKTPSFIGLSLSPIEVEIDSFALFEFKESERKITIIGQTFQDFKAKKQALKKWKQYPEKAHVYLAKQWELYEKGHWFPRGIKLRKNLWEQWSAFISKEGIDEVKTSDPKNYFNLTHRPNFALATEMSDTIFSYDTKQLDHLVSKMRLWIEPFKFNLSWRVGRGKKNSALKKILKEKKLSFVEDEELKELLVVEAEDARGLFWPVMTLNQQKDHFSWSLIANFDQFIGLILERNPDGIPFWLTPEQAYLFVIGETNPDQVYTVLKQENINYTVFFNPTKLKEKVHRALRIKVPYVMVFGKQEGESGQIIVNTDRSHRDQTVKLEDLGVFLAERNP